MRILYVVNYAEFFLSHRLVLAQAARALGYDVHVAGQDGPLVPRVREHGLPFHVLPRMRGRTRPLHEATTVAALIALYRRLRPSLVHHVSIKPVLYGTFAARVAGVPAVVNAVSGLGSVFTAEGFRARARRRAVELGYRASLRHPRMRVIVQNAEDERFIERVAGVDRARIVTIRGSGVDLDVFRPRPEPTGRPVVVLPARMLFDKGVGEFVEAARLVRARGVDATFALVGGLDPDNPSAVPSERIQQWVARGDVEWWGHRSDMPDLFGNSHVVCLPSYREGLSKALIEAAACGRPIVTTDVPGCRDVVDDGVEGLLVPVRDPRALADALEKLLRAPTLRTEMGARGRARAEAQFGVESVVAATMATYERLLEGLPGHAAGRRP